MTERVLFIHQSAELYGSDRMFIESVVAVQERGAEVVAMLPGPGPLVGALQKRGIRVVLVDMPVLRKTIMNPAGLVQLARQTVRSAPEVLQLLAQEGITTVYVNTVVNPLMLVWARLAGKHVVLHVHETADELPAVVWKALCAPAFLADTVIVNSAATTARLADAFGQLAARAVLVRNAIGVEIAATAARADLAEPVRLVFVGRVSHRKGVHVAIAAVKVLRDGGLPVVLHVVGSPTPGKEEYAHQIRALAAELGVADAVTFTEFTTDVAQVLADADIALVPSIATESFGNVVVEALAAGRPVVVGDRSGLREAAAGYEGVRWHEPGEPESLARGIRAVVADWPHIVATRETDAAQVAARHGVTGYRRRIAQAVGCATAADAVPSGAKHSPAVAVAVLTFRRNELLAELIPALRQQTETVTPHARIVVVDNDPDAGARDVAKGLLGPDDVYVSHPVGGIAEARNRAVTEAEKLGAQAVVFVDDDETPSPHWLRLLVEAYAVERCAGVVGPVVPVFQQPPPRWAVRGGAFRTARRVTGSLVPMAATNNLLLDVAALRRVGVEFDPAYSVSGGSDTKATWALTRAGEHLVWVDEAVVEDRVPPQRVTPQWVLQRGFRSANGRVRVDRDLSGTSGLADVALRARYGVAGAARVAAGAARAAWGMVCNHPEHTVRGARTAARGAGMVSGAFGYVYCEYRRKTSVSIERAAGQP